MNPWVILRETLGFSEGSIFEGLKTLGLCGSFQGIKSAFGELLPTAVGDE
jgi:hypothetical protein